MSRSERLTQLDALRAIAALVVVLYHGGETFLGRPLFPRGFLAVDFFFLLSGYVMARAYDDRLQVGMPGVTMVKSRMRRLYPTMAIGVCAGAVVHLARGMPLVEAAVRAPLQLLFVPVKAGDYVSVYPLNGVQWSLFFELLANAVHALILWRLTGREMKLLTMLSAAAIAVTSATTGSLMLGADGGTFLLGVVRVAFPYLAGVLLFRMAVPTMKWSSPALSAAAPILLVALLVANGFLFRSWAADALVVTAGFPLVLIMALAARPGALLSRLGVVGGGYSYPLYAIHLPAQLAVCTVLSAFGWEKGLGPLVLGVAASLGASIALQRFLMSAPFRQRRRDLQTTLPDWPIKAGKPV